MNGSDKQYELEELKEKLKRERESLVLWKRPFSTLNCFIKELTFISSTFVNK